MKEARGFSLIETLVVIAIFSVIGVSLVSSFSVGMRVWKRSASANMMYRRAVINLERLGQELRQSIVYPAIGFFGEDSHIAFAALLNDKVTNVSYSFDPQKKAVFRSDAPLQQALGPQNPTPARKVITGVQSCSFSYYYFDADSGQYASRDSWNYTRDDMPLFVTATLAMEDGEEFEKVIPIPVAQ